MQTYQLLNLTVSSLALAWTMGLIIRAWFSHGTSNHIIDWTIGEPHLTGAGWAFTLWSAWWLSLVLIYIFLSKSANLFVVLLASDLGNLTVLGAAIAYCRANAFRLMDLLPLFLLVAVIPISEMTVAILFPGPAGRVVAIAPSAVLATAAMVAMGWAVLVRCGWRSAPFFFMMAIYAVLQLPAYIYSMAFDPSLQPSLYVPGTQPYLDFVSMRSRFFDDLRIVFYILAGLKIIVALAFLGYFFSPHHKAEALNKGQAWPSDQPVPMDETYAKLLKWGAGLLGSLAIGLVLPVLEPNVLKFLKDHLPAGN